ncbi:Protein MICRORCHIDIA 6 [Orobanche hederae]
MKLEAIRTLVLFMAMILKFFRNGSHALVEYMSTAILNILKARGFTHQIRAHVFRLGSIRSKLLFFGVMVLVLWCPFSYKMSSANLNSNHGLGELGAKAVKLEQDISGRPLQQNDDSKLKLTSHGESNFHNGRSTILKTPNNGASFLDQEHAPTDDPSFCSTSSICPAPICRQFWKAGNYDDRLSIKSTYRNGTGYLRIHPKFLHSNATSHKWAFGAMAELLDNSVDEIRNGATFVIVDKTSTPRDGNPALLIQDDGGGMDPEAMRRCLSFGFSDKKSKDAIGRYGNGFKTSSMRLGADVVVFSRCQRASLRRRLTQSVGLLSYTFLMQTRHDRIVVPMVDYEFDTDSGTWKTLHSEQHLKSNLSILLQWSPVATEAELMKQCDDIGAHGTKIIIYNLWHNCEGKMELDFESDSEDIYLSSKDNNTAKSASRKDTNEQHLANRIQRSLRAYLSVLYLRAPENFCMLLRGRVVEYHNIANDLKYPEFILYRPQNVEVGLFLSKW